MLMECLAAGRSISLPGSNTGMQKMVARAVGAYARVRYQFKTAIGRFEGVEEALTRIGANTYLSDAARVMTAGAIDLGEKPRWCLRSSSTTSPSAPARRSTTAWT